MAQTIYTGPGKVYFNSVGLFAQGESGQVNVMLDEATKEIASAHMGFQAENVLDQVVRLTLTPFDSWGLLRTLFPAYLGVTVGAGTGALVVGTRAHDDAAGSANGNAACKVFNPAGQLLNIVRAAVDQPPSLRLGPGEPLFGQVGILGLGDVSKYPGDSAFLIAGNALTESAASDPGGNFAMSDFIRGRWTGAWGSYAGFGGDAGSPMEAEDFWEIQTQVKFNTAKVSGLSRHIWLASVRFIAKCKLVGPTRTQIAAKILAHTLGQRLGAADLVLTGPSSKTITLKNCEVKGMGIPYGGSGIAAGEIAFVTDTAYTTGAPQPTLIFSA